MAGIQDVETGGWEGLRKVCLVVCCVVEDSKVHRGERVSREP